MLLFSASNKYSFINYYALFMFKHLQFMNFLSSRRLIATIPFYIYMLEWPLKTSLYFGENPEQTILK